MVAGSGFLGAVVAERIANELNEKVLIVERRDHIGGNCFSEVDTETGIEYHKYGTHIFHTSNPEVWEYINLFTGFNNYRHQVLAHYQNKLYQLPVNLETINSFFNVNLRPFEVDGFLESKKIKFDHEPNNFEEKALSLIGKELYEAFFKNYTTKQWHIDPKELPAGTFSRLPVRKNYDENYFFDTWQGIPVDGYGKMFSKILEHENIDIKLSTDFFDIRNEIADDATIIYSGPIDRFFDYKFGRLEWRTLKFEKEIKNVEDYQGNCVINYPEMEFAFTRIHEPKHLHPERKYTGDKTIIFKETSLQDDGTNPYYPIANENNNQLIALYKKEAEKLENVFIAGRLGDYKYYDMHETINRALEIFKMNIRPKYRLNAG